MEITVYRGRRIIISEKDGYCASIYRDGQELYAFTTSFRKPTDALAYAKIMVDTEMWARLLVPPPPEVA